MKNNEINSIILSMPRRAEADRRAGGDRVLIGKM